MQNNLKNEMPEISIKILLDILFRYKYLIASFVIVFTLLASVYAYLKQSIYISSTTIIIKKESSANQFFSIDFNSAGQDQGNEIALIKSGLMVKKVLNKLDIGTRYYYMKNFKQHEMYKSTPYLVKVLSMENILVGKKIYIEAIDDEHFRLSLKKKPFNLKRGIKSLFISSKEELVFTEEYSYGEEILTKWFKIKINKLRDLKEKEYFFTVVPNKYMGGLILGGLSANFKGKSGTILQIYYEDTVPLRAKEVVNAVTETYFEDEISEKLKVTDKTLLYLDTQLEQLTKILNKSATKLKSFKQSNTNVTLENITSSTSEKITEAQSKLRSLEFEESVLSNLQAYIDSDKDLASVTISESEFTNSSLLSKIEKYQELNEKYREGLTVYTEFHPEVIKAVDDLNRMRTSIKYLVANDLITLVKRKNFLQNEIDTLEKSLVSIPQKERKLASLTRNFAVNEKIYSFLLEKRTEMKILYSSTTPNIRILDEASIPGASYKPNRGYTTFIGGINGFLLGALIAFILYMRDDTIKDITEVESGTKAVFFGMIPIRFKGKYTIAYEEAYRTLRTNLEFVKIDGNSKTVLVASSISGEGKSTTIKNIADMLIKLDRKVIVLDFDLRRPSLHEYFANINNEKGLSLLLSGQNSIQESIQKTKNNIDIMTAGPTPPNPSELIMSDGTQLLLKTLNKTYDYILIDTPPYSVVTDATILMQSVDIVLFSIMSNHSKRNSIKYLNEIIEKYEITSAGLVFHGIKLKKKEHQGYGYFES